MSYDSKCYDLAETFLKDGGWTYEPDIQKLAQRIQDAINDYMAEIDREDETRC